MPSYAHLFSPKKFSQPQLLACLVLKEFLRLDYRGFACHLADHPDLAELIGMKVVPHFTTFQKAAVRLLAAVPSRQMFDAVLKQAHQVGVQKHRVRLVAMDGTGLESRHVSRYFTKRQADGNPRRHGTYTHFPKVVFAVDCQSHMILAAVPGRGPATDLVQFDQVLSETGAPSPDQHAAGRCRFRRRACPCRRPLAGYPDNHSATAGPADGQTACRAMAACDEIAVQSALVQVRPTLASGNCELDGQTETGLGAWCAA